jgi:alpha-maltose-1-phosphate synthase
MNSPLAVNVNLSTSGSRLGGAAIAAEFHCRYMAKIFPTELWRMWDSTEELYTDNLKVQNFATNSSLPLLSKILPSKLKSLLLTSDIANRLKRQQPSIIHLHNPLPSAAFASIVELANRNNIKVVASTHGFFEVMNPNYGLQPYEKIAWQQLITKPIAQAISKLDGVFSLYPEEKAMLTACGVAEEKLFLAPNGVNPFFLTEPTAAEVNSLVEKFSLDTQHPILLFIGNHTANKGLPTVMQLGANITSRCTIVVGGKLLSPEEPSQWQQQFPPNQQIKVVFTDYLTLAEQRVLYRLSTMLLFPSRADTLPLTIIEAMASSLPVVAYNVGGIPYQLAEDCGVVVKSEQFPQYLQAVETLLSQPERRYQIASNAKARQKQIFAWEKTAASTVSVYQHLLSLSTTP